MSSCRAFAKALSVPTFTNPFFSKTFCEAKLSNVTRPKIGLIVSIVRSSLNAFVAIPCPQNFLSIQYVISVLPSITNFAILPTIVL